MASSESSTSSSKNYSKKRVENEEKWMKKHLYVCIFAFVYGIFTEKWRNRYTAVSTACQSHSSKGTELQWNKEKIPNQKMWEMKVKQ